MIQITMKSLHLLFGSFVLTASAIAQPTVLPLFKSGEDALGIALTYPEITGAPGVETTEPANPQRPDAYISLRMIVPDLQVDLRYLGTNNFVGRRITGHEEEVALALREVQQQLATQGLGLKVFDAYRPQRAVDDFMEWAADADDTAMKAAYYPGLEKAGLRICHGS